MDDDYYSKIEANADLTIKEKEKLKLMWLAGKAVLKEDIELLKELAKY